jgi:hypothetical protein
MLRDLFAHGGEKDRWYFGFIDGFITDVNVKGPFYRPYLFKSFGSAHSQARDFDSF